MLAADLARKAVLREHLQDCRWLDAGYRGRAAERPGVLARLRAERDDSRFSHACSFWAPPGRCVVSNRLDWRGAYGDQCRDALTSSRTGPGPTAAKVEPGNGQSRHNQPMRPDLPLFDGRPMPDVAAARDDSATPADQPRRALDDLRERLARLPVSHPSSRGFGRRAEDAGSEDDSLAPEIADSAQEADPGPGEEAGYPDGGEAGEQPGQSQPDLPDRLGRLDRLSRVLGGGHRSGSDGTAGRGRGGGLSPGSGKPGPYRPWFAPGELCQPWFRPDPSDRSD